MAWVNENLVMILGVALALSEALALIPGIKANSIFQAVVSVIKALLPKAPQA